MNSDSSKKALRIHAQTLRKRLSAKAQAAASTRICNQIRALDRYQQATRIALYHAVQGEVDLNALRLGTVDIPPSERLRLHPTTCIKHYYFPVMNPDQTLSFLPTTQDTLFYKNRFGIPEPEVKRELAIRPEQLDIIFLPLVAFDEHGTRVGMGGGYYDRTLAHHRPPCLIGVAHDNQRQAMIKPDPWDVPLTAVITERTIYWSK